MNRAIQARAIRRRPISHGTTAATHAGWPLWLAGSVLAVLLGGGLAYLTTVEPFLLAQTGDAAPGVGELESAQSQYLYATRVRTEQAWQAVIDNFPDDAKYVNLARKQLVWHYLLQDDYDRAMGIFQQFDLLDDTEQELRAFGLAGQYCVLTRKGDYARADQVLERLWPLLGRRKLDDPWMGEMLRNAMEKTLSQRPGTVTEDQLRQYLEQPDQDESQEEAELG